MWILRKIFDKAAPHFEEGGKLHVLYPLFEVIDTFFYTPSGGAKGSCHVRDTLDFKRMMMIVVYALIPCTLMAMYNTGYQANHVWELTGQAPAAIGWRAPCFEVINKIVEPFTGSNFLYNPHNVIGCFVHGAFYFLPIYIVTLLVGGIWEVLFSIVRKHEVNEGFLVTGLLFPLTLPATIPLWQVACGISFGVVFGKEIFGGTGRNWLNPALIGRAYLFFAHAAQISGESVWTAVDGYSSATPLTIATSPTAGGAQALATANFTWLDNFIGLVPGSMGETSTLACLFGALVLVFCGVGSWRIMVSMTMGALGMAAFFNLLGSENTAFSVAPHWHLVLGGFAFGAVFMATDPISAAMTKTGQCLYGLFIGVILLIVRVLNPAFPEGTMLAILLGNVVAPLIDYYVVKFHIARRTARIS